MKMRTNISQFFTRLVKRPKTHYKIFTSFFIIHRTNIYIHLYMHLVHSTSATRSCNLLTLCTACVTQVIDYVVFFAMNYTWEFKTL
jgi:hypothetical protein